MDILDSNFDNEKITENTKSYLLQTTKWAKFLAIVGFFGIGTIVIFVLSSLFFGGRFSGSSTFVGVIKFISIFLSAITLYFLPIYFLYQFAVNMQDGLKMKRSAKKIEEGFKYLKFSFRFMGVLMVIGLAYYLFTFIVRLLIII